MVGRFLEHSRVYGFQRDDERRYWLGSADLMPRNLDTRVELLAPVEDPTLKREIEDTLERTSPTTHSAGSWNPMATGSAGRGAPVPCTAS